MSVFKPDIYPPGPKYLRTELVCRLVDPTAEIKDSGLSSIYALGLTLNVAIESDYAYGTRWGEFTLSRMDESIRSRRSLNPFKGFPKSRTLVHVPRWSIAVPIPLYAVNEKGEAVETDVLGRTQDILLTETGRIVEKQLLEKTLRDWQNIVINAYKIENFLPPSIF